MVGRYADVRGWPAEVFCVRGEHGVVKLVKRCCTGFAFGAVKCGWETGDVMMHICMLGICERRIYTYVICRLGEEKVHIQRCSLLGSSVTPANERR